MKSQINQVSDTALMAAAYRAMETNNPNAIFHDPLAAKLAGDWGKKIINSLPILHTCHPWQYQQMTYDCRDAGGRVTQEQLPSNDGNR